MISLVNSESLKESTGAILDNKLISCYNYKLYKGGWITYKDMEVNSKTSNGITELIIDSSLKVHESYKDDDKSYYGMNKFRHDIIVLQILLGICGNQQSSNKLRSLTMNIKHTDYGVTHWVSKWKISSVISTTEKSWELLNNALEGFDFVSYLQKSDVSIAYENSYDALIFDQSDLTEYFESIIGVDSDEKKLRLGFYLIKVFFYFSA